MPQAAGWAPCRGVHSLVGIPSVFPQARGSGGILRSHSLSGLLWLTGSWFTRKREGGKGRRKGHTLGVEYRKALPFPPARTSRERPNVSWALTCARCTSRSCRKLVMYSTVRSFQHVDTTCTGTLDMRANHIVSSRSTDVLWTPRSSERGNVH